MKMTSKLASILAFGVLLGLSPAALAASATGSFERSIAVDRPIFLDVTTGSGSIRVRAGDAGRAEVTGTIRVGSGSFFGLFRRNAEDLQAIVDQLESEPPVELRNGVLLVGHIKDSALTRNVSISYEITVPASTRVKSITGSGSQDVAGVSGPAEVRSGSGALTLNDISGAVSAHAGSGSISADNISGAFEAHAGSGRIRLTQSAPGDVDATTGSGSIELRGVVGALHAHAGSGRILVAGRQQGAWDLNTGSGSISVDLPDDAAFELDAESSSGSITVDHPVTVHGKMSRRHLRGPVRGGGDLLRIDTGSGSIRIE